MVEDTQKKPCSKNKEAMIIGSARASIGVWKKMLAKTRSTQQRNKLERKIREKTMLIEKIKKEREQARQQAGEREKA